jgi:hypothetical protein
MELTPQERKQIERLRKQERQWPLTRWILLGGGVIAAAEGIYILLLLFGLISLHSNTTSLDNAHFSDNILAFAVFWPQCLLMMGCSFWFIAVARRDWHGNIQNRLLLKLLEVQQNQPPGPAKIT